MKKLLIATTALVAGASAAAADVSFSGFGRFGLSYVENRTTGAAPGTPVEETQIISRLRITASASTETDVGVTFGAKLRFQNDTGSDSTTGNAAQFSVGYEGLKVAVGNIDTAWDSVGLTYDSEMGIYDTSFGDAQNDFYAYNSKGTAANTNANYVGIAATYSISGVNVYFSYVDPNQATLTPTLEEEIGLAADWSNGQISVAGAILKNAEGADGDDALFVGAAYSFGDANVGLNYYDYDNATAADSSQVTLYGNYAFGATTLRAYVSDSDVTGADTAYGIGADYSLGEGARLSGSIQSGFQGQQTADVGVRFDF